MVKPATKTPLTLLKLAELLEEAGLPAGALNVLIGSGRVVGCHIVGPDAGEMIQLVGIAVKMNTTKADFDRVMAVHPTAAEELVTMREKAYTRERQAAE